MIPCSSLDPKLIFNRISFQNLTFADVMFTGIKQNQGPRVLFSCDNNTPLTTRPTRSLGVTKGGGTRGTLTGCSSLMRPGLPVLATRINRLVGQYAYPTPATQPI